MFKNQLAKYAAFAVISFIILMAIGWSFYFQWTHPPVDPPQPNVANPNFEAVLTQVFTTTLTPGPAGQLQIATLIPTPQNLNSRVSEAELQQLRTGLQDKEMLATLNTLVTAYVGRADLGWYCNKAKLADPRDINNVLAELPYTEYGVMSPAYTDIYGGIVVGDIITDNIKITSISTPPIQHQDQWGQPYIEEINGAAVELRVRWGVLSVGPRAGNQIKVTFKDVNPLVEAPVEFVKLIAALFPDYDQQLQHVFEKLRDEADNKALEMAIYRTMAPLDGFGQPTMEVFGTLKDQIQLSVNTPGENAYEFLREFVTLKARLMGVKGPVVLTVILEDPQNPKGNDIYPVYYLMGLDEGTYTPVLPNDLATRYSNSTCPDYTPPPDVKQELLEKVEVLPKLLRTNP